MTKAADPEYYIKSVAFHVRQPVEKILSKSRERDHLEPRQVIMYTLRKFSGMSLNKIAEKLGKASHATVKRAVENVEYWLDTERDFQEKYTPLLERFETSMKVYIAGKVSGVPPKACKQKFDRAKEYLTGQGYLPVSPMDLVPEGTPWAEAMKICIVELCSCDAIYLLNDYDESPGAMIEAKLAGLLGIIEIK